MLATKQCLIESKPPFHFQWHEFHGNFDSQSLLSTKYLLRQTKNSCIFWKAVERENKSSSISIKRHRYRLTHFILGVFFTMFERVLLPRCINYSWMRFFVTSEKYARSSLTFFLETINIQAIELTPFPCSFIYFHYATWIECHMMPLD